MAMQRQPSDPSNLYDVSLPLPDGVGKYGAIMGPCASLWITEARSYIQSKASGAILAFDPLLDRKIDEAEAKWLFINMSVALAKPGCGLMLWLPSPRDEHLGLFTPRMTTVLGAHQELTALDQYISVAFFVLQTARMMSTQSLPFGSAGNLPLFEGNLVLGLEDGFPGEERIREIYASFSQAPVYTSLQSTCNAFCSLMVGGGAKPQQSRMQ